MLLCHLPMSRILSGSMRAVSIAISPPTWRERACEAKGQAFCAHNGADGCRDLGAADGDQLVFVAHRHKRSFAGGAMKSKVCDMATQRCHCIYLGIACSDVADESPLDTIFMCGEEKAERFCPVLCG